MNKREQMIAEHVKTCLNSTSNIDFTDHKDMVSRDNDIITVKYYDDANPKWSHAKNPRWNTLFSLKGDSYTLDNCGYNTKMTVTRLNTVLDAVHADKVVCIKNKKFTVIDLKSRKETVCEDGVFNGTIKAV